MAEYINKQEVLKELECGIRAGNYEDGYENYMHINDMGDCVDTVKYFDTSDVIELEPILEEYEELIQTKPTSKQIDEFCIKTMRKILCDYYVEKI